MVTSTRTTKKKKVSKQKLNFAHVHIQATYNNTIVTITDTNGNVVAWSAAGILGFKGPKKSTSYVASLVVKDVLEKCQFLEIQEVAIFVKGVGQGREGAIRAIGANGLKIALIKDKTPIPHNGCRPKKVRRV